MTELVDAPRFFEMTGEQPENDDLDRCNCPKAGIPGHLGCGVCRHNLPVFQCQTCFQERHDDFCRRFDAGEFRKKEETMSLPKITHVAIIFEGKVYSLPAPNRHHHVIRHIVEVTGSKCVDGDEGFLDETGQFLKREPAKIRAEKTGQLKQQIDPHESLLFSEDLW